MNRDLMKLEVRDACLQLLMTSQRLTEWASRLAGKGYLGPADEMQRMANHLRRAAKRLTQDLRMSS